MRPTNASVTIDGNRFNALSAEVAFTSHRDEFGAPNMGQVLCGISVVVDLHDDENMPFDVRSALYETVKVITAASVKDIKIEFWKDEAQQDAICSWSFSG